MFISIIKIQVLHLWFNKIKLQNQLRRSWSQNTTPSQNNVNVITSARRLLTRISLLAPCCCHSAPTNNVRDHNRYQPHDTKLQGWVHYKKNQYQFQITTNSKEHRQTWWAYTTSIIQHSKNYQQQNKQHNHIHNINSSNNTPLLKWICIIT